MHAATPSSARWFTPLLRRTVEAVDRDLPVDLRTQREQINATMQVERAVAALTAGFVVEAALHSNREEREPALLFGLGDDGIEVSQHFRNGNGIDFAACVVAFFDELLEMAAGYLGG